MEEKKTPCECPLAGLCNRHNMNKTPHYHKLCQNHQGYFNQWEDCKGPGQDRVDCLQHKNKNKPQTEEDPKAEEVAPERPKEELQLPSMAKQAKNFAGSLFKHALTGFGKTDEATYEKRLDECANCEFYMANIGRCSKCGCFCATKASWKSSKCPIGKW
jgi:hypothetical protein